jgi:hypothetical protein
VFVSMQYISRYYDMLDTDVGDGGDIYVYVHLGTRPSTPKKIGGAAGIGLALLR